MKKENIIKRIFKIQEIGVLIPLVILIIIFGSVNQSFFRLDNVIDILHATTYIFIAGIGVTYIFLAKGLDLSLGSQLALDVIVVGLLLNAGVSWPIAIIIVLILGLILGAFNGFLIVYIKIPAFIATLATLYIYRGIVSGITKGRALVNFPEKFTILGKGTFLGIPYIIFLALLIGIIAQFVLIKIPYGRYIFAVGGNIDSARLSGINTKIVSFSTYVLLGVLMSISGIFWSSRLASSQPGLGTGFEFKAISAVIIGGISLYGGQGSIYGTFFGALFLVVLQNGLTMVRINQYWQMTILGFIIIFAIVLDIARKNNIKFRE